MWKETKVVKNVSQYNFDARYGVYVTNEGKKNTILHIGGKEIMLVNVFFIQSFEDKIFVMHSTDEGHNNLMVFTKEGELFTTIKDVALIEENTNRRYVDILEYKNFTNYFNLVDVETGKVIFNEYIPKRKLFVFGNMIFSNRDNIIIRHDWDGSILWQHDYQPDFNVTIDLGILLEEGVCGGKLWVKSKHDWHEILLAIDVNTGELVRAFSDSEEDTDLPHCNIGDIGDVYLNFENNHILVVTSKEGNAFLNFIDAKTLEVFERTPYAIDSDNPENVYILEGISEFKEDYITFKLYNSDRDYNASGFLIYNYKTKKVVFAHHIFTSEQTNDGWMLFDVQYQNNSRIFAYDFAKRLHIFEDVKE